MWARAPSSRGRSRMWPSLGRSPQGAWWEIIAGVGAIYMSTQEPTWHHHSQYNVDTG